MRWSDWTGGRRAVVAAGAALAAVVGVAGSLYLADGEGNGYHGCRGADANYDAAYPDYPAQDAQDWVSFGDHVTVFHIREGSERQARGERSAEIVVDKVLHSRDHAKKLPDRFRAELWQVPCAPWIKAGHTYLGLMVFDSVRDEPPSWRPVHSGGVLPYDHESIGSGEIAGKEGEMPYEDLSPFGLSKQMHGEHALTLQSLLMKTEPHSEAAKHPDLSPGERYERVREAQEAGRDD
ncbi:hypothetical protein [Streptomyces sp. NPDC059850]|uniref:hypothetical protein n=1 Tax=Streptomyces sp. NPDC059850 TaxID=3346970 RepID=UPI003650DB74